MKFYDLILTATVKAAVIADNYSFATGKRKFVKLKRRR